MITCCVWTASPTFNAHGSEPRNTDTCPVSETTLAAFSGEEGNICAEHTPSADAKRSVPASAALNALANIKKSTAVVDANFIATGRESLQMISLPPKLLSNKWPAAVSCGKLL